MTDYSMPVLSEREREELLSGAVRMEDIIGSSLGEMSGEALDMAVLELKLIRIALAALTAKPVAYKDSLGCFVTPRKGELLIQEGEAAYPLFMAPPVPVIKQEAKTVGEQ